MGRSFEKLVRALLIQKNTGDIIPFRFTKIGDFWTRKGDVEIDIVALNEDEETILFAECKLKGNKFTQEDAKRLKEKSKSVKWKANRRKEHFALFSAEDISATHKRVLERDGIAAFDIKRLLSD